MAGCSPSGAGGADSAPVPYPAGPYGSEVGQVLPDFAAEGYRLSPGETDSTKLGWDPGIRLSEYHADSRCRCLLVTLGAKWCPACEKEQPQLVTDVNADPSFCVLGVLQEGLAKAGTATKSDVDAWTQHFDQNFNVVLGSPATETLISGSGFTIGLPFAFVVSPATMKVLDVRQGFAP